MFYYVLVLYSWFFQVHNCLWQDLFDSFSDSTSTTGVQITAAVLKKQKINKFTTQLGLTYLFSVICHPSPVSFTQSPCISESIEQTLLLL